MPRALARVRFEWDVIPSRCRAIGLDAQGKTVGSVCIELDATVRQEIWQLHGESARLRLEEVAERHLRGVLALRL